MHLTRLFAAIAMLLAMFAGTAPRLAASELQPIEIRLVADEPAGGTVLDVAGHDTVLEVEQETLLGLSEFVDVGDVVWTVEGDKKSPGFNVTLTPAGAQTYEQISTDNVGRTLAIIVDGQIVMAARILDPVRAEGFLLTMNSEAEAEAIAQTLRQALAANQ